MSNHVEYMSHDTKESGTRESTRRRFLKTTGVVTTGAAVAGCTGDGGETETPTSSGGGGDSGDSGDSDSDTGGDTEEDTETESSTGTGEAKTFRTVSGTLRTLDPIKATAYDGKTVLNQVFETLTQYENGEINIKNLLAEDFSLTDGGKTLVFELREDATFSNGEPVTAADVVYSWERLASSPNSRRATYLLGDLGVAHGTKTVTNDEGEEEEVYKPGTMEVSAPEEYTLEVTLQSAFHAPLKYFALIPFGILPEGLVDDVEGYDGELAYETFAQEQPVGSGPFTLEKWTSGTELVLDARDDYHGEGPHISGVNYKIASSNEVLYTYSINKNSDTVSVPISKYNRNKVSIEGTDDRGRNYGTYGPLSNDETVSYLEVPQTNVYYIGFSQPRTDRPVRRAFSYAMNRQTIIDRFLKGLGRTAFHVVPPALFPGGATAYEKHAQEYPYGTGTNIEKARQVMEEAGYSSDNMYEITLTVSKGGPEPSIGKLLQSKLRSAHVKVDVKETPNSTLLSEAAAGKLDCYTTNWTGLPLASNFSKIIYPPWTHVSYWKGESWKETEAAQTATEAFDRAKAHPKPTEEHRQIRGEAYVTMEEANWTDVVLLPMYHQIDTYLHYDWVDRPRIGARGDINQRLNTVKLGERS
jgi:peptide/nickel transport system substrate-binding protein